MSSVDFNPRTLSSSPIPSFRLLDLPAPIILRISIRWTDHRLGLPTPALSRYLARLFGTTVTLALRTSRHSGSPGAALREECQRDVVDCDVVRQLLRFRSIRRHLPAALLHTVERGLLDVVALLGGRAGAKVLEEAMEMAARRGHHDIFVLLLQFHDSRVIQEGPRTSTRDDDSRFPYNLLESAVEALPILEILLGRCLVDGNHGNHGISQKDFNLALERTCATSNLAAMSALLHLRTQLMDRGVRVRPINFQEHLVHSVHSNNIDLAQFLLDNGASPNDSIDGYHYPLETVILNGNLAIFKLFIRYGATIPPHHPSPLYLATSAGHVQIVEALLDAGANVDSLAGGDDLVASRYPTDRPLTVAIMSELDVARLLLARGADVLLAVYPSGPEWPTSPIAVAASQQNLAFVQLLCDHIQKDENAFDIGLRSAREQAIHDALAAGACVGSKQIVEFLLSRGANPNLGRYFGESALTGASRLWGVYIVQILLKHGADVSIDNDAPIRAAFSSHVGHGDIIVQLLDSGAQVHAVELEIIAAAFHQYGRTAFNWDRYERMIADVIQRLDVDFCRQLLPHINKYDKDVLGRLQRRIDSDNSADCVDDNSSMSRGRDE
ncbi:hypothetical protein HDU93_007452 [Gonapodya sp. JEL0774]|nr:hypothetical protein HDU93_007452 [Gonapodya sp. JEL0774]